MCWICGAWYPMCTDYCLSKCEITCARYVGHGTLLLLISVCEVLSESVYILLHAQRMAF